jgi:hypothetical protein
MTRSIAPIEPGETVQPRMARGRWEIDTVPVGGPQTVRVDTVTSDEPRDVWLETPTGDVCVSESALQRCECGRLAAMGAVCWACGDHDGDGSDPVEDAVSDALSARERHCQEEQEYRELNEAKTRGVLL